MLSSVLLAVDNPLYDKKSTIMIFVNWVDKLFTILFFVEMMIKTIGIGFMFNNLGPI